MKYRNPISVALLTFITLGIYSIYWYVQTKEEMNARGANIPTAWWLIVPIANIWWIWKYSEGVEKITNGKISTILSFILLYLLSIIGMAILQDSFNKASNANQPQQTPVAPTSTPPVAPTQV